MQTVYATIYDLATWMAVDVSALPADAPRLLRNASLMIDYVTMNGLLDATGVLTKNQALVDAANSATCAQCELWILNGEDSDYRGQISEYGIGKVRLSYAKGSGEAKMAPRARMVLWNAGLLSRAVRMGRGYSAGEIFFGSEHGQGPLP